MDFEKYRTTLAFPDKNAFRTTFYYLGGQCVHTVTGGVVVEIKPGIDLTKCVREDVLDEYKYRAACTEYYGSQHALDVQFKKDLLDDLGITDNPRADKLYSKAYERGHSGGYQEVYNAACDLVELIT